MRVLRWIVGRVNNSVGAVESPLGMVPTYQDLDWLGSDFSEKEFSDLMSVNRDQGLNEALAQVEYFEQFKKHLPPEFLNEVSLLSLRLNKSDEKWTVPSSIVKAKKKIEKRKI